MFTDIVQELADARGIPIYQMLTDLGFGKGTFSTWKKRGTIPSGSVLQKIADYFGVSVEYLLGKEDSAPTPPDYTSLPGIFVPKMKKVPLLGKTACGEPIYSPNYDDGFALLPEEFAADFALEAKGDSMTGAHINDGDIVYFVAQDMVDNGQIAAVAIGEEVTLKKVYYYRESNKLVLQPENPNYEPLIYTGEELNSIRIIGRAVAHLRKL